MSFQFKQFTIQHNDRVFKFGTDAALLATWVDLKPNTHVLEIGCGSGVITLMMAQRQPSAHFTGIDVSLDAIKLSESNTQDSGFQSPFTFTHQTIQDYSSDRLYDTIVSNPPFFESSTKSPTSLKNTTRHTDTLSLVDLLTHSKRLLLPNGTIQLIYPIRYLDNLFSICQELELYPIKVCKTRSTSTKPLKRVLISIGTKECIPQVQEILINGSFKGYSEQVYHMLKPFLLKL